MSIGECRERSDSLVSSVDNKFRGRPIFYVDGMMVKYRLLDKASVHDSIGSDSKVAVLSK